MILEGLVTTLDSAGVLNLAPMGPIVNAKMSRLTLRPFRTSRTYRNLRERPYGVFHITDDVLLMARAALDLLPEEPATEPAESISGRVLQNCCRWYEFRVIHSDESQERALFEAEVLHMGRRRDFLGFNRARHAVLEATILATRLHLLPREEVLSKLSEWQVLVDKTAGVEEQTAWRLVYDYVARWFNEKAE